MQHTATQRDEVQTFFSAKAYAVVGVSANKRKFGNIVYRAMRERGLTVYPIHPVLDTVEGERCYNSISQLPGGVRSIVTVVHPDQTERVVRECSAAGVTSIWMQQGSESAAAVREATDHGLNVIHGHCILMFLEPVRSIHALHRWIWKLIGRYPR